MNWADQYPELADSPTIPFYSRRRRYRGQINQALEIMQRGLDYIRLPKREFQVAPNRGVTTQTRSGREHRCVGISQEPVGTILPNTITRELVLSILGRKDINFQDDHAFILFFRDLILRIAGAKKKRGVLQKFRDEKEGFIKKINGYRSATEFAKLEAEAIENYSRLVKELQLTHPEQRLIRFFSWEWKSQYALYPYSCRCWMIIVCVLGLINTEDVKK